MIKNILNLHLEILSKERQKLLEEIVPYTKGFILGGGTALALQLNHRQSYDFDFFSTPLLAKNLLEKLSQTILITTIAVDSRDELTFFTKDGIKVTFLHYPFGYAFPIKKLENGLNLFSVKDIAIKKAYTIGRRGEYRDYFDLYTILKDDHISLEELSRETKKIYGSIFEEKIFLEQLVYFKDLQNFDILPVSAVSIASPKVVESFFNNLVSKYLKE
ncbi:MAG: nucleotidyl transferase AbiEii/AbiGii toxin family protein [Candidatus Levyibacteriota bacterium]